MAEITENTKKILEVILNLKEGGTDQRAHKHCFIYQNKETDVNLIERKEKKG